MNIVFHVSTAVAVIATLADTRVDKIKATIVPSIGAFVIGIVVHGALDYAPHKYPLSASVDCIAALLFITLFIFLTKRHYKLFVFFALVGSIFPDIIDLSPSIINRYIGLNLPIYNKIFPWHLPEYSGSIFTNNPNIVSTINHILVILATTIVCWIKRDSLKDLFIKKE